MPYVLLYTFLLSAAYIYLKQIGIVDALFNYGVASLIIGLFYKIREICKKRTIPFHGILITRGFIFGTTQILIIMAMETGSTSHVILTSVLGLLVVGVLSKLLINEKFHMSHVFTFLTCLFSFFLFNENLTANPYALASGIVAGITPILTRLAVKRSFSTYTILGTSTFYGGLISCLFLYFYKDLSLFSMSFSWGPFSLILLLLILIQVAYINLLKVNTAPFFSALLLSRIPVTMLLEYLLIGEVFKNGQLIGGGLLLLGATLPTFLTKAKKTYQH